MDTQIISDNLTKSFSSYPDEYQEDDSINGKEIWCYNFQNKYAENAITMLIPGELFKEWYDQINCILMDISKTCVIRENPKLFITFVAASTAFW